jgi:hypothetical protein
MAGSFVLDDLDVFFNPDEIGDTAVIGSTTIRGQFNDTYRAVNTQLGTIEVVDANFMCKASDVTSVKHGDAITTNGATYVIIGIEPGDPGVTNLILRPQ